MPAYTRLKPRHGVQRLALFSPLDFNQRFAHAARDGGDGVGFVRVDVAQGVGRGRKWGQGSFEEYNLRHILGESVKLLFCERCLNCRDIRKRLHMPPD